MLGSIILIAAAIAILLVLGILALGVIGIVTAILGFRRGLRRIGRLIWGIIGVCFSFCAIIGVFAYVLASMLVF